MIAGEIAKFTTHNKQETVMDELYIVIPALNEEKRIAGMVDQLLALGYKNLIVVDDGSSDNTAELVSDRDHVTVLDHIINLGPGAATMTGIQYALIDKKAKYIATIDADLQHHPKDLIKLVDELRTHEYDLVIGNRFQNDNKIPSSRVLYNWVGNWVSYLKTGHHAKDSQSGIKVFSRKFAENLNIDYNGFEFCIEIIKEAKLKNFSIGEFPVSVSYSPETMEKGQSFSNGLMMLGRLLNPF